MPDLVIRPQGAYALAQSINFLQGFIPASGSAATDGPELAVAFRLDGSFAAAGARLAQLGVELSLSPVGPAEQVSNQTQRILGVDQDARGWDALAKSDPVLGKLLAEYPGWRPVSFSSPYDAAVWGVLAQRISMKQAAAIKKAIATELGDTVTVGGRAIPVFPSPKKVLATKGFGKVPEVKWARLQAVAEAARAGLLDADRLKAMPKDAALAALKEIDGVGEWTAAHILLRGTGVTDLIELHEPRVVAGIEHAYGKKADVQEVVEGWRPFRTWAMVLVAFHLGRSGKWNTAARGRRRG